MILTDSSAYDAPYGFFGDNIMQGSKENIVNILLLAGASKKNISWIMKLRDELLEIQKYSVSVFNYTHWKDGGEIDILEEAKELSEYLSTNDVSVVIAKSAGSLVTATANMYTGASLKKAIFIGFPLEYARERCIDYETLLQKFQTPTLYIQAAGDPMGSYDRVHLMTKNLENTIAKRIERNDHNYKDIPTLIKLILSYINDSSPVSY